MNKPKNQASLNPHVENQDTPAIPLAGEWASSYDGTYGPLIDLSQAVPNYPPHPQLLEDLSAAAADPANCGYGDIEGEPELRQIYSGYASRFYGSTIDAANIHITAGCNQAFFATLLTVARPASTVVMTNPCYFNHKATAELLGLDIRYVDAAAANGFVPDIAAVERALDDTVSVMALVSPNNPTGAVYPPALLSQIAQLCHQRNIWLMVDETYREFAAESDNATHNLFSATDWGDYFIQLYSFSKAYSIPGHRLGAVVASQRVVESVVKVMDNLQICAPRPAQRALAGQMTKLDSWVAGNNELITERAMRFRQVIEGSDGWQIRSIGGYFAYIEHPFGELDSTSLVKTMASRFGVLPLPGVFFGSGQERFLRMAFANADCDTIDLLKDRLALLRTCQE